MIEKESVERVMEATDIVDVIGDFVSLKRRGANYIACCPFHYEKTPSFSVSRSKGIYKCFGCGKAGSAVTFLMEHESMSYIEAIKYLGRKYGIEINEKEESPEDTAKRLRHESMLAVSDFAAGFFTRNLFDTAAGRAIGLSYFKEKRGFTDETIRKFGLGYSPDPKQFTGREEEVPSLAEAALKNGYKREFLIATGLCYEHSGAQLADKFYDRVMFPIHSLSGRVIAFGGRTLRTDKSVAKYMNSPESEIYHKSRSLYGIFQAKSSISRHQKCYLVEGYTDVISMHQAGIENVVASSGTSLTTEQIRLIRRFTTKVTVLYDGDAAGIKASLRGIDMLLEEGLEIKVVLLPDGEDPDSFARSRSGEEMLEFLESHETDFIEFKYRLLSDSIDRDPIRRAELIREIVRTISVIPDQIVRSVYIEQTAQRLSLKQELLFQEVAAVRKKRIESGEYERLRREEREESKASSSAASRYGTGETRYPSPDEESSGPEGASLAESSQDIAFPILEPSERELLYFLLKYGEAPLVFEEEYLYGSEEPQVRITVSEYIDAQLKTDDLEFMNTRYRRMYDYYFRAKEEALSEMKGEEGRRETEETFPTEEKETGASTEEERIQKSISGRFINSADNSITELFLGITVEDYTLNVKNYLKALTPERQTLGRKVPKAVLVYKLKYTEYTCNLITEEIGKRSGPSYTETDPAAAPTTEELTSNLKLLLQIRTALMKELNRH